MRVGPCIRPSRRGPEAVLRRVFHVQAPIKDTGGRASRAKQVCKSRPLAPRERNHERGDCAPCGPRRLLKRMKAATVKKFSIENTPIAVGSPSLGVESRTLEYLSRVTATHPPLPTSAVRCTPPSFAFLCGSFQLKTFARFHTGHTPFKRASCHACSRPGKRKGADADVHPQAGEGRLDLRQRSL